MPICPWAACYLYTLDDLGVFDYLLAFLLLASCQSFMIWVSLLVCLPPLCLLLLWLHLLMHQASCTWKLTIKRCAEPIFAMQCQAQMVTVYAVPFGQIYILGLTESSRLTASAEPLPQLDAASVFTLNDVWFRGSGIAEHASNRFL